MINLPLYLLSFELDTQDSLIGMLEKSTSYEIYTSGKNYGKKKPLISEANVAILEQYKSLCAKLQKKPSVEMLKQQFPTLKFDGIEPLGYEQLEETIKLDLDKLAQKDKSYQLMNISNRVNTEGITAEVVDDLLGLAKLTDEKVEYKNILGDLKEIYTKSAIEKGIPTGIEQVDNKTGGLQPGTFNTLAGFAGAGKTTAAVNICYNALREKKNVCYITMEVPKIDMNYNFLSRHSFEKKFKKPISHSVIKKRELTKEDAAYLFDEILPDFKENFSNSLYILDETDFDAYTFTAFENRIRACDKLAQETTGRGIDLLVIDQAQLLKFGGGIGNAGNETSVINLYVSFFRQQAINFLHNKRPCTILMLSQINRDGFNYASKHEGRYTLTNLAEANELERASAMVIALYSDEGLKASQQVSIQLLKSRNGETIVDPFLTFMDPKYYVFGSEVSQTQTMFNGDSMSEIFELSGNTEAINLFDKVTQNQETGDINFDAMLSQGKDL